MFTRSMRGRSAVAALVIILAGCSTLGQGNLDLARDALKNSEPAAALAAASEAIVMNPKFTDAKAFLRDNTDPALQQLTTYLAQTEKTANPADLEKRFWIYSDLIKFYDNLRKIGLPLAADAQFFGLIKSWEWTTPIQDFNAQKDAARAAARSGFYAAGGTALADGDLNSADGLMAKVIGMFAVKNSDEQVADSQKISGSFLAWADGLRQADDPDSLIKGIKAYDLALKYDKQNTAASDGQAAMKLRLSDRYLTLALDQERIGTVDTLKGAIGYFKNGLKYNKDNQQAADGVKRAEHRIAELFNADGASLERSGRLDDLVAAHGKYEEALKWDAAFQRAADAKSAVTAKIAEYHYQEGVRLSADRKNAQSIEAAVAAFTKAGEWIPDYKDSALLSQRLFVSREILILEEKIGYTQVEFDRTQQRIVVLADLVGRAKAGMDDLNYVADAVVQLDQQMTVLSQTASALAGIPVIGTVLSVTGTALSKVHVPVNAVSNKIDKVRKPVIEPAREAIGKINDSVGKVVSTMDSIRSNLDYVRKILVKLNACLLTVAENATVASIEADVKELNKVMDKLNTGLNTVNDVQDKVEGTLRAIADGVAVVTDVRFGVETVMRPLNKIKGVTDEISDVLKTNIKIPLVGSFTVEKAINSTTGLIKKAAEAILNPILNKLNIEIPSIPGIDRFEAIIDKVEGYYADVTAATDRITGIADEIVDLPNQLRARADAILAKSGCSL